MRRLLVFPIAADLGKAHKHLVPRNSNVIKLQKAVIDGAPTHFGTNVTKGDARQGQVVLQTPELHDEAMRPKVLALDKESGEKHAVGRGPAQPSWPPLDGSVGWGMKNKLIFHFVEGGSSFQPSQEGPMAELSLRVGSNDAPSQNLTINQEGLLCHLLLLVCCLLEACLFVCFLERGS